MFFLKRTLNINSKIFPSNGLNSERFFSILYPINYNISCKYFEKYKPKPKPNHECRHFSVKEIESFNVRFYDFVTSSGASKILENIFIQTHDVTGLPWWTVIIVTATAVKLLVGLPLGIYQQHLVAKINLTKLELDGVVKNLKEDILLQAKRGKWTKKKATLHLSREVRKHWKILVVKNNCHPFKSVILSVSQLPVWILFSMTLRKFALEAASGTSDSIIAAMQFQIGGVFWSPNLTLPDLTLILPVIITLCSFIAIELNILSGTHILSMLSKIIAYLLRGFAVLSFFISMGMPSCVSLYWATSLIFGLAQQVFLLSPRVRRFFRIPKTPKEVDKPYSHILNSFVEKWGSFFRKCFSLFVNK